LRPNELENSNGNEKGTRTPSHTDSLLQRQNLDVLLRVNIAQTLRIVNLESKIHVPVQAQPQFFQSGLHAFCLVILRLFLGSLFDQIDMVLQVADDLLNMIVNGVNHLFTRALRLKL